MFSIVFSHPTRSAIFFRALPFAVFIGALALRAAMQEPADDAVDTRWLYLLQLVPTALLLLLFARRYGELRARPGAPVSWLLALVAGGAVFGLWINATLPWMRLGEPAASFMPLDGNGALIWPLVALRVAGAVLVVPLMEELFWRSFLMRWLDQRDFLEQAPGATSLFALVASSAVFALAHDLWLAGFIAGLVYGVLYVRTGNLWYPIAAHALTNLLLAVWVVHGGHWAFW